MTICTFYKTIVVENKRRFESSQPQSLGYTSLTSTQPELFNHQGLPVYRLNFYSSSARRRSASTKMATAST